MDNVLYVLLPDGSSRALRYLLPQAVAVRPTLFVNGQVFLVREIADRAFSGVPIANLDIPSSIERIGTRAFADTTQLETLGFQEPAVLKIIGYAAFTNSVLQSIRFPPSLVLIAPDAFRNCRRLQTVIFTANSDIREIRDNAFSHSTVARVVLPDSLTNLARHSFAFCPRLTDLTLSSSLKILDADTFRDSGLVHINISRNLTQIDGSALTGLVTVAIDPENPALVDDGTFLVDRTTLSIIRALTIDFLTTVPAGIVRIGPGAFFQTKTPFDLEFQAGRLVAIDSRAFAFSAVRSLTLPPTLQQIGDRAFYKCELLSTCIVPEDSQLVAIGDYAFAESGITAFRLPARQVDFGKAPFARTFALKKFEIPASDSILIIPPLFLAESAIWEIALPANVKIIGPNAFGRCRSLFAATFADGGLLQAIGEGAFADTAVREIVVPASVVVICDSAFENSLLGKVEFAQNSGLARLGKYVFAGTPIREIAVPPSLQVVCEGCFAGCRALARFAVPENSSLQGIDKFAFRDAALAEIEIPQGMKIIEGSGLIGVKTVVTKSGDFRIANGLLTNSQTVVRCLTSDDTVVPPDVFAIGRSAFEGLGQIVSVTFAQGSMLRVIQERAFRCSGVAEIAVPDNVETIESHCFFGCRRLHRVTFGAKARVRDIQPFAFAESGLTALVLPDSLEFVDGSALTSLEEIAVASPASRFSVAGKFLLADGGQTLVRFFGLRESGNVQVPNGIVKFGPYCFAEIRTLTGVICKAGETGLVEISENVFVNSTLKVFDIPKTVTALSPLAFEGLVMVNNADNPNFVVDQGLLYDQGKTKIIKAFTMEKRVEIPAVVEVLGSACFRGNRYLKLIEFQVGTVLRAIEELAFEQSALAEIVIPGTIKAIGEKAFPLGCVIATEDGELPEALTDLAEDLKFRKRDS
jgi:hypothetical protein